MVVFYRALLIITLFVISNITINKIIGKRARKYIFSEVKSKYKSFNRYKLLNINTVIFLSMLILALINGYSVVQAVLISGGTVGILYCSRILKKNTYKKQVLNDLLNVSECLRVQLSSQIPLGTALRSLPELCVNKEFSGILRNMCLEYELSKFIIFDSEEVLQSKFNYPEIRIFISSLNQQIQGTSAIEAFDNLISILREKYIEFLEEATKNKIAIMTIGVFGIVINIAVLGVYPIAVEAFNAINVMLK